MATEYVISIKVTGSESASGPLGAVGGALGRVSEMIAAGVIFRGLERLTDLLQDAGRAAWENATGFQTLMSRIAGLTDTTSADLGVMGAGALGLSRTMDQTATDLADAMYFIASSGFEGAQALDILRASGRAASAGLGDTKTVADAVTSTLNAYKLSARDAGRVTDILTEAVVQGKGEPDALAGAIGRVLPIAAAAGVNFEQVAASLATMTRTGLNAEEAATALRGMLGNLFAPSKETLDALDLLGMSADDLRASIRERGLLVTLEDLMKRTGGNIATLDMLIPNVRSLTGFLSTAASQGSAYADVLKAMEQSQGRTDKAFAASGQTWEFQWGRMKNVLLGLPIEVGQKVLPELTGTLTAITAEVDKWAGPLVDKISGPLQGIATRLRTAAEAGGIEGVIGEIGKLISEGWTLYVEPQIKAWTGKFWEWITGKEGAQAQVPATMSRLLASLQTWADDPKTQAQMTELGLRVGQALAKGLEFLVGQVETWTPIFIKMTEAMGKTIAKVGPELGGKFAQGFFLGMASELAGKDVTAGGFSLGIPGLQLGVKGLGGTRQHGGSVLGGLPYLVGERGPEMYVPERSGTVVNHSNTFNLQPTQYRNGSRSLGDEVRMLQLLYGGA